MDVKEEEILGDGIAAHWYYHAKGQAMLEFLKGIKVDKVIDVGAGSGVFSRQLIDNNICKQVTCIDPNYDTEKVEDYSGVTIAFRQSLKNEQADLILMMDVLEHVEDDTKLLTQYFNQLKPGGYLLITVPAFQFLWSGHDVFLEHYRRYTLAQLNTLVSPLQFSKVKSRYFFASLFPVITILRWANRIAFRRQVVAAKSDLKNYPRWLNKALVLIHTIERKTLFKINKLFGLSAFMLCRKEREF